MQGIGLMMATALLANGATVYVIGFNQAELDKSVSLFQNDT